MVKLAACFAEMTPSQMRMDFDGWVDEKCEGRTSQCKSMVDITYFLQFNMVPFYSRWPILGDVSQGILKE